MTAPSAIVEKRTRESASKVRTGCATCKARRVKCDEGKPFCRRCTVGGRNCDYSTSQSSKPMRTVIKVYVAPMAMVSKQPTPFKNTTGLDFFHQTLGARLDGQFDSKFWSMLVMQLSQTEPAIQHAVSAISVIHRDVDRSISTSSPGFINADPAALREWQTAMSCLSARIKAHPSSNFVPLVCCLLFTCLEFMKGNVDSALVHVQSGFNILDTIRKSEETTDGDIKAIETYIVPMFSRLNPLCTLFGRVMPPVYSVTDEDNAPHADLTDARQRLFGIMDPALRFIRAAARKAHTFELDIDDYAEQVKLQFRLDQWREQLEELLRKPTATGKPPNEEAINILLIQYKVVFIWLAVCTSEEETAVDRYNAEFGELVEYANRIIELRSAETRPDPLSFEMQLIGPLYYTAVKCRVSSLRRRALQLLQLAPRREGLWNAHHAFKTAQRVIELEEAFCNEHELPSEPARLHGVHLPTELPRIYNLGELPGEYRKIEGNIVPHPAMPGKIEVVFQTKPWGVLGPFHTIKEHVTL